LRFRRHRRTILNDGYDHSNCAIHFGRRLFQGRVSVEFYHDAGKRSKTRTVVYISLRTLCENLGSLSKPEYTGKDNRPLECFQRPVIIVLHISSEGPSSQRHSRSCLVLSSSSCGLLSSRWWNQVPRSTSRPLLWLMLKDLWTACRDRISHLPRPRSVRPARAVDLRSPKIGQRRL